MGLFSRKFKDPVRGTAQVVSATMPPESATSGNCRMTLVIQAEGIPAYTHRHHNLITPVTKWPWPGEVLPVEIERADHEKIRILWDEVTTHEARGLAEAEQMARAIRDGGAAQGAAVPPEAAGMVEQLKQMFPGATVSVQSSSVDMPPGAVGAVEQALGVDLDGDGVVGPGGAPAHHAAAAAPPPATAPDADDRIAQLERLARLRDSGALSDAEFEAEKRRVLGS
ncbi:MAG: SHOCT domain-containing protein [Actinomycetota bacterium]